MVKTTWGAEDRLYDRYDKKIPSGTGRRCIDGSVTGRNKCVGYCQYCGHPGFLTQKLRDDHQCREKQCCHYVEKQARAKAKAVCEDCSEQILAAAKRELGQMEAVKPIRVTRTDFKSYVVFYVSITKEDPLCACEEKLSAEFDVDVTFSRLAYDFEICAAMLCSES